MADDDAGDSGDSGGSSGGKNSLLGSAKDTTAEEKKHTKQQRIMIVVGVLGLILTYILLRKSSTKSSGTGSATTDPNQALAQYEQQNATNLSGLAAGLQQLQAEVAGVGGTSAGTGGTVNGTTTKSFTPTDFSHEVATGLGVYQPGTNQYTDSSGDVFEAIANPAQLQQYLSQGYQPYYQPQAGVFMPYSGGNDTSSTPTQQLVELSHGPGAAG